MFRAILASLLVAGLSSGARIARDNPCLNYTDGATNVELEQLRGLWFQSAFAFDNKGELYGKCGKENYTPDAIGSNTGTVDIQVIPIRSRFFIDIYDDVTYDILKDPENPNLFQFAIKSDKRSNYVLFVVLDYTNQSIVGVRCEDVTNSLPTFVVLTKDKPAASVRDIYDLFLASQTKHGLGRDIVVYPVTQKGCYEEDDDDDAGTTVTTPPPEKRNVPDSQPAEQHFAERDHPHLVLNIRQL